MFNNKISPICLPNGKSPAVGRTGITTGWVIFYFLFLLNQNVGCLANIYAKIF